jgi:predicted dehydrogenase
MAPIKVGVVGCGNSARVFHLPYILNVPDLELYAFMQRAAAPAPGTTPSKPHCTVDYPSVKHYRELEAFLADDAIELVVVLTQQDSHAEIAEKALRAGKHGMYYLLREPHGYVADEQS